MKHFSKIVIGVVMLCLLGGASILSGNSLISFHPDFLWNHEGRATQINLCNVLPGSTWEILNKSYAKSYNDKLGYITFSFDESSFTLDEGVFVALGMLHIDTGSGSEFVMGDCPYEIIDNQLMYVPWKSCDKNGEFRRNKKDYALMFVKNKNEIVMVSMGHAGSGICLMKRVD